MSIRKADIIPENRSGRTGMKLKDRKEADQQGGNRINREEIRKKSFHPFQPAHQEETR